MRTIAAFSSDQFDALISAADHDVSGSLERVCLSIGTVGVDMSVGFQSVASHRLQPVGHFLLWLWPIDGERFSPRLKVFVEDDGARVRVRHVIPH